MAPANFQLVMQSGPTPGKSYPLEKNEIFIGRDINNDIVISDAEISRKHSRLVSQGGGYTIEDMGSTNGTFVNGQRLMGPHALTSGELIMLGENVGLAFEAIGFDINATVVGSGSGASATFQVSPRAGDAAFSVPPVVESYGPPAAAPQAYAPPPSAGVAPVPEYPTPLAVKKGGCRTWLVAGCGCLAVVLCLLVIAVAVLVVLNPALLEEIMCWGFFKSITNGVLQSLGSPYYCP
ncbi:MAG: FHA domain-containing protein [Chloroflexota bacterium]